MQASAATPYVYPRAARPLRLQRTIVVDELAAYRAEFGGLDRRLHADVQRELQLLAAPGLPGILMMVGLFVFCVLGTLSPIIPNDFLRALFPFHVDLAFAVLAASPMVLLFCAYLIGFWWLCQWAAAQRFPLLALPFGLVALGSGALSAHIAIMLLPPWALLFGFFGVRVLFLIAWTNLRSLFSRCYCLARLASYEREATTVLSDAFNYDPRPFGLVGLAVAVEIWLIRKVTRPFIRPSNA